MLKELELDAPEVDLGPREAFLRAKLDLYLSRAVEAYDSHRYPAVLKELEQIQVLDPVHPEASQLKEHTLARLRPLTVSGSEGTFVHLGSGSRRQESVLIIDQDPRVLSGLGTTFRSYGFNVLGAGSFDEGMEALGFTRPRVVVSEVNFESGPNGLDLFQHAYSMQPEQNPVFVFLAARIGRELEIAGRRAGVNHFALKPFDNDVLATTVLSFLTRKQRVS
jgi:CheY-like chemotaxis protein